MKLPNTFVAYASATAIVVAATLIRYLLSLIDPKILVFSSFYPAILACALLFGIGPGLFSLALSAATAWVFFLTPASWLMAENAAQPINFAFFLFSGGLIVWIGSAYRSTQRKLRLEQDRRAILLRELEHRSKNALTVAQSIVLQSLKGDRSVAHAINGRLHALLTTNDLITQSEGQTITLASLLDMELAPFNAHKNLVSGTEVRLPEKLAQTMALVFHELLTNAAKYGALSTPNGYLTITWRADETFLHVTWTETAGPTLNGGPTKMGFGSTLIRSVLGAIDGTINKTWAPTGMTAEIRVPIA